MCKDAISCPFHRMVADEKSGSALFIHTVHHAQRPRRTAHDLYNLILNELFDEQIAHLAVRISNDDAFRARVFSAGDGRIGLGRHPATRALVFLALQLAVIGVHDTGDALNIHRNQNFHFYLPIRKRVFRGRS